MVMHDYYSILGISPYSNFETIKQAYRKRAIECHPDRGGSHEQMILVNEAWLILSDSTTRSHYDSAIKNIDDELAQRTAQKDSQDNRQKAEEYPKKWDDFKRWFDDNYDTTYFAMGLKVPTGGADSTRWLFIIAGGFLGLLLASSLISQGNGHGNAGIAIPLIAGGAWLGVMVHYQISKK
jgi:curved DNA-binding protein CbpA